MDKKEEVYGDLIADFGSKKLNILVFLVLRGACGAIACMGWSFFLFCRTQLAYLSLARLLARLETPQECLVRGTRR